MIEKTLVTKQLAFKKVGSDRLYGKNVLGIVLKIEWATLLKGGPMFAIVGETLTSGKRPMRLERVGRPEIKNVTLSAKMFDQLNRNLEIRELYNNEDAFNLSKTYIDAYRARFNANLAFFDGLDGKTDWPIGEHGNHPLTELLLADFLIVDVSKPFSETQLLRDRGGGAQRACACDMRRTMAQPGHRRFHSDAVHQRRQRPAHQRRRRRADRVVYQVVPVYGAAQFAQGCRVMIGVATRAATNRAGVIRQTTTHGVDCAL